MTKMQKFIDTLNDYELGLVKEWTKSNAEDLQEKSEDEAVHKFIVSLCWHYKTEAEYAERRKADEMLQRKAEVNKKWKELGLT